MAYNVYGIHGTVKSTIEELFSAIDKPIKLAIPRRLDRAPICLKYYHIDDSA
jgi:hypothetical protein